MGSNWYTSTIISRRFDFRSLQPLEVTVWRDRMEHEIFILVGNPWLYSRAVIFQLNQRKHKFLVWQRRFVCFSFFNIFLGFVDKCFICWINYFSVFITATGDAIAIVERIRELAFQNSKVNLLYLIIAKQSF